MAKTARRAGPGPFYYSKEEMASLFGVSIWTIYLWARHRRVPVLRVGGTLRFPRAAIDRFIAERTRTAR
jgi:excisionase family DNA binding protein